MRMTRSMLFVPGDSERKLDKALAGDADALILDLEDSVVAEAKAAARSAVAAALRANAAGGKQLWVRVNALETGLLLDDLAAVVAARPFGVVIPKCSGRRTLEPVHHYLDAFETAAGIPLGSTRILAIATETARSLFELDSYAGVTARLWGLTWGAEDLGADVGSFSNRGGDKRYTEPYRLARSMCLFAAAACGVHAIDSVCVDLDGDAVARAESREGVRDGFSGKLAIHPRHVAAINESFAPDAEQRAWAGRVIEAFAANPDAGALRLDGQMIDRPHLRLARRLLGEIT